MEQYIRPSKICKRLCVTAQSLNRWESEGKLKSFRTPGGHRRYLLSDVMQLIDQQGQSESIANLKDKLITLQEKIKEMESSKVQ